MSSGEQDKLDELLELTRDNNRILHKMRRTQFWSSFFSYVYWLAILGALGWSVYYLQPYVEKYWNAYQAAMKTLQSIEETGRSLPTDINSILEKVQ